MTETRVLELKLTSTHKAARDLGDAIAAILADSPGVDESLCYNIQLAAHEVCTNIVDHAYNGRHDGLIQVKLTLSHQPPQLTIEFRDRGHSFDPSATPEPDLDEPQEGGYGLFLARALMDDVLYQRLQDENRWHLVKNLSQ
jgi:serine/threonine-protein kinase RsbW